MSINDLPGPAAMPPRRAGHLLAAGLGLFLCGPATPSRAQEEPARLTRAAVGNLNARCARCHGQDGTGGAARGNQFDEIPNFGNHKWQVSRSDAQLLVSILDGKGSHMPPYRGKLSEQEARELVAQVRALDPQRDEARGDGRASDFEQRFRELQKELAELKKQLRDLSEGKGKR
jgi:mono/diheme cytochrome c family protein